MKWSYTSANICPTLVKDPNARLLNQITMNCISSKKKFVRTGIMLAVYLRTEVPECKRRQCSKGNEIEYLKKNRDRGLLYLLNIPSASLASSLSSLTT
jgi:hypothetical protein